MAPRAPVPHAAAALLALVLGAAPAMAEPRATPVRVGREADAEARFRAGSAAFDQGHLDEACVAFDDSLKLYPTLTTLLNLALCYENQGKTASAWRGFNQAAAWASDAALRDRRDFAHDHALRLERSLSRVELHLPDGPPVSLAVDHEPVPEDRLSWPLFLDPGEHLLEASAPAHVSYATKVTVPVAGSAVVVVEIPPLQAEAVAAPSPPPPSASPSRPRVRRVAGWIVGGAGVVAVGLGTYFGVDAISKTRDDAGSARTSETASLVAFGAGLAGLATGTWLVFGSRAAPVTARLLVVPRVAEQGAELGVSGAW